MYNNISIIEYLRMPTFFSSFIKLIMAMFFGGLLGINRVRKGRAAGFRTYMLVCMGATIAMMLSLHLYDYNQSLLQITDNIPRVDVTRLGAQVINGVGFLGAGTILVIRTKEVQGVTTAAGLWASACMGLGIGAGFYEGAVVSFVILLVSLWMVEPLERYIVESSRNMNCYVEFRDIENIQSITNKLIENRIHIYDMEIEYQDTATDRVGATFYLVLPEKHAHFDTINLLSTVEHIITVEEI